MPVQTPLSSTVSVGQSTMASHHNTLRADALQALEAVDYGTDAQLPASPAVGDVFLVSDDDILYACFDAGTWQAIASGVVIVDDTGVVTPQLSTANVAEGSVGRLNILTAREVHTLAAAGTSVTSIDIPIGALVLGVGLNVDTVVSDDGGDDTWAAAFSGGGITTTIAAAGTAAAQNTKVDTLIVPEKVVGSATNVTFTAQGGSFDAGVIEVLIYYMDLTSLADV